MLDSGDYHTNAIQLGHEAYRNGITGNEAEQKAETIAAVMGHAGMAGRMLGYKGNEIGGIYGLEGNLYNKGQFGLLNMLADGLYDSSADYWLFRSDGTFVDDKNNFILHQAVNSEGYVIDYINGELVMIDEEGTVKRKATSNDIDFAKVKDETSELPDPEKPTSDFSGSRAVGLLEAIKMENLEKMTGKKIQKAEDVPLDVLVSATNINKTTLETLIANGRTDITSIIFNKYKKKIIAEGMLYELGSTWDADNGIWTTSDKMKIPGLNENESLGVSMKKTSQGKDFTFFTAGFDMSREDDAFEVWVDGLEYKDRTDVTDEQRHDAYANTTVSVWKRDLFTGNIETYTPSSLWDTVSSHSDDTTRVTVNDHEYKGNTIVSEYFKMHMLSESGWGMNTIGVITDAQALNGKTIHKNGREAIVSWTKRWLFHSMPALSGGSAGCQGSTSDLPYTSGTWNDPNQPGSGASHMNEMWNVLKKQFNIYDGYEFSIHLQGKLRP